MSNNVRTGIAVAAGIVVVGLFFIFNDPLSLINSATPAAAETQLLVQDEVVGTGAVAETGDTVDIHYTAKLDDGTVIETSLGGEPDSFVVGAGTRIQGWEQGVLGMQVGGKRLLIVPPALGYGAIDYGPIPANSTLIFELELVKVVKGQ